MNNEAVVLQVRLLLDTERHALLDEVNLLLRIVFNFALYFMCCA